MRKVVRKRVRRVAKRAAERVAKKSVIRDRVQSIKFKQERCKPKRNRTTKRALMMRCLMRKSVRINTWIKSVLQ